MHVVCEAHRKRSLFFENVDQGIIVLHRSDGERCWLPLMLEGHELHWSAIDRALRGEKMFRMRKISLSVLQR